MNGAFLYALDVGQGDAILIKTVDNKYILVDGGPDSSVVGELQDIIPYWDREIDVVILTHPDQDHVGGLPAVLEYFEVKNVMFNHIDHNNFAFEQFQNLVEAKQVNELKVGDSTDYKVGCCTYFDMLWPSDDLDTGALDVNDSSIAFVLMTEESSVFLGGDLASDYELDLFRDLDYDLDILKVGHHGSKTSTSAEFVSLINPQIALISVGEDNKFGHPHENVLDNLKGAEIRRTDLEGRVRFRIGTKH